jgi:hypothetical protein
MCASRLISHIVNEKFTNTHTIDAKEREKFSINASPTQGERDRAFFASCVRTVAAYIFHSMSVSVFSSQREGRERDENNEGNFM